MDALEIAQSAGIILGEEAHIRSSKADGPRHDESYPVDMLDSYENLILLCPTHHTKIDKDGGSDFPVEMLVAMKATHEEAVDSTLGEAGKKRRELCERTAVSVAIWEKKLGLDDWHELSYSLNTPRPTIARDRFEQLQRLCEWLLAKRWDKGFPALVIAFENHRLAMADLSSMLSGSMKSWGEDSLMMHRETVNLEWDEDKYERLSRVEDVRAAIIFSLVVEATRSVNFVIDAIIEDLDPYYRFDEGLCLMFRGDGFTFEKYRLGYSSHRLERGLLYPGMPYIESVVDELVENKNHDYGVLLNLCADIDNIGDFRSSRS
nr:hypothetical protein [Actinospica robiniae]